MYIESAVDLTPLHIPKLPVDLLSFLLNGMVFAGVHPGTTLRHHPKRALCAPVVQWQPMTDGHESMD